MSVVGGEVNVMKANIGETNAMDTPFTSIGLVGQWHRFVVTSGVNDIDIQLDYRYPQLKSCSAKGGGGVGGGSSHICFPTQMSIHHMYSFILSIATFDIILVSI